MISSVALAIMLLVSSMETFESLAKEHFIVPHVLPSEVVYFWKDEGVTAFKEGESFEMVDLYLPAKARKWQSGDLLLIGDAYNTRIEVWDTTKRLASVDCQVPLPTILNAQWLDGALLVAGFDEAVLYVAVVDQQGLVVKSARFDCPNMELGESEHLIYSALLPDRWVIWTPRNFMVTSLTFELEQISRAETTLPAHIKDYRDSIGYRFHQLKRAENKDALEAFCDKHKGMPIRNHATGFAVDGNELVLLYYQTILQGCINEDGSIDGEYRSAIIRISPTYGEQINSKVVPQKWLIGMLGTEKKWINRSYSIKEKRTLITLLSGEKL